MRTTRIWLLPTCLVCLGWVLGCGNDSFLRLPDPAVRYVAFGDSSTRGPSERDYVTYLPNLLGESSNAFSNEGDGGETSAEGVTRLRSLIDRGIFPNAVAMLYWEGGGDLIDLIKSLDPLLLLSPESADYPLTARLESKLDEIQANIEAAIRLAQDAGWDVYVATYFFLPRGSLDCDPLVLGVLLPGQADNANAYVTLLNERIRQAAQNRGAVLVDVADSDAELRGDPANYQNCNHLSAQGNQIVAGLFAEAIAP
ncbi:MAG: SGNH/GDSL hydrolase family protein [Phycisphaerae bacterium]|nr:SGNH/GDSL hydrolase family protein [Phycisphaerae bacterium]